jgi:hypothetical protein
MPRKRKRGVVGRPTKLTVGTAIKLGHALGRGQSVVKAARSAGVGKTAVYRWLLRALMGCASTICCRCLYAGILSVCNSLLTSFWIA